MTKGRFNPQIIYSSWFNKIEYYVGGAKWSDKRSDAKVFRSRKELDTAFPDAFGTRVFVNTETA